MFRNTNRGRKTPYQIKQESAWETLVPNTPPDLEKKKASQEPDEPENYSHLPRHIWDRKHGGDQT